MGNSTEELVNAFNLNNYGIDKVNINFIVEGKKIVSSPDSLINIKEYLKKVRGYIIENHCRTEKVAETEKVAKRVYDFGQFPFVFPPNFDYEGEQETIVIADNVSDAVFNLKTLFSREYKKDVDAIDINVVKKIEEYEKKEHDFGSDEDMDHEES